jgi:hypothetical protein
MNYKTFRHTFEKLYYGGAVEQPMLGTESSDIESMQAASILTLLSDPTTMDPQVTNRLNALLISSALAEIADKKLLTEMDDIVQSEKEAIEALHMLQKTSPRYKKKRYDPLDEPSTRRSRAPSTRIRAMSLKKDQERKLLIEQRKIQEEEEEKKKQLQLRAKQIVGTASNMKQRIKQGLSEMSSDVSIQFSNKLKTAFENPQIDNDFISFVKQLLKVSQRSIRGLCDKNGRVLAELSGTPQEQGEVLGIITKPQHANRLKGFSHFLFPRDKYVMRSYLSGIPVTVGCGGQTQEYPVCVQNEIEHIIRAWILFIMSGLPYKETYQLKPSELFTQILIPSLSTAPNDPILQNINFLCLSYEILQLISHTILIGIETATVNQVKCGDMLYNIGYDLDTKAYVLSLNTPILSKIINGMTQECTNGQPANPTCINAQCQSSGFGYCANHSKSVLRELKEQYQKLYEKADTLSTRFAKDAHNRMREWLNVTNETGVFVPVKYVKATRQWKTKTTQKLSKAITGKNLDLLENTQNRLESIANTYNRIFNGPLGKVLRIFSGLNAYIIYSYSGYNEDCIPPTLLNYFQACLQESIEFLKDDDSFRIFVDEIFKLESDVNSIIKVPTVYTRCTGLFSELRSMTGGAYDVSPGTPVRDPSIHKGINPSTPPPSYKPTMYNKDLLNENIDGLNKYMSTFFSDIHVRTLSNDSMFLQDDSGYTYDRDEFTEDEINIIRDITQNKYLFNDLKNHEKHFSPWENVQDIRDISFSEQYADALLGNPSILSRQLSANERLYGPYAQKKSKKKKKTKKKKKK